MSARLLMLVLVLVASGCEGFEVSRALGARCAEHSDCLDSCLPPSGRYPGGFCTLECLSDAECPAEALCADESGGVCLLTCLADADCAFLEETGGVGWSCVSIATKAGGMANACVGPGTP